MIAFLFAFFMGFGLGSQNWGVYFTTMIFACVDATFSSLEVPWADVTAQILGVAIVIAIAYSVATFLLGYIIGKKWRESRR